METKWVFTVETSATVELTILINICSSAWIYTFLLNGLSTQDE